MRKNFIEHCAQMLAENMDRDIHTQTYPGDGDSDFMIRVGVINSLGLRHNNGVDYLFSVVGDRDENAHDVMSQIWDRASWIKSIRDRLGL